MMEESRREAKKAVSFQQNVVRARSEQRAVREEQMVQSACQRSIGS